MDSTYVEMAVSNCSSEIGQCNNFAASATSLASYGSSSPMMHSLESTLNVTNANVQPDSSKEMPPPSTIPGVTSPMFSTVEFSGFSRAACDTNDSMACGSLAPKSSASASSSASISVENQSQVHMVAAPSQATSQAIFQQHPSSEGSVQYFQTHLSDQRPGSVSASPGPSGSCGSGGSPAPSTSLSHPSVGSPWSFDAGSQPNCETPIVVSHAAATVMTSTGYQSQVSETSKSEKPMPPKKPLTPYMRFSKSIWQQVKAANPSLSVCEVGATIGRMWREMNETDKQRYNDDFANDKVRYDGELQSYLKATGLQASDLVRPKAKKKDVKDKAQTPVRQPIKPQAPQPQYGTSESGNGGISTMSDQTIEPQAANVTSTLTFNGSTGDASLQTAGFQAMGVGGEECGGGVGLGTLPHFSQVWAGQDVYANPQLLAQMGMNTGQTIYANQAMSDSLNASGLITIQPQDVNQNDGQMTAMYSQSQSSQQVGNQCVPAHQNVQLQQMSVEGLSDSLTSSLGQTDSAATMASNDNAWLWQQYNAGNQFVQDALTQSSGSQAQSHEGVIIYQLTSDGTPGSLVRSSMESGMQNNHNIPMTLMAKQAGAGDGTMEAVLEPGEVPLSSQLQVASNGPIDAGLFDLNQLYGLTQWNQVKDEKMDFAQPVDGEKQLLRSALFEKTKEIQRLTKELEMAYGLIHHLKQESNNYQRHWDSQQLQQQQQLHSLPKGCTNTDNGTGISINS